MKRLLVAVALGMLAQTSSASDGPWDGIYSCGYNVAGFVYNVYVTINGYPDGRAIWAVAAVTSSTPFYGFGVGTIVGNTYSGTNLLGLPFQATATTSGFNATMTTVSGSRYVTATGTCLKVW